MEAHFTEWLNLGIRWIHMITGIAWIGASFYFVWLENNLNRSNPREGLSGDLWAIHGGGIYHLEKYKLAPPKMPENLHWFKWEAYATWLSGVALMLVVYYLNPSLYLVKPGVDLAPEMAIAIGFGSMVAGYETKTLYLLWLTVVLSLVVLVWLAVSLLTSLTSFLSEISWDTLVLSTISVVVVEVPSGLVTTTILVTTSLLILSCSLYCSCKDLLISS
jgi:uncharacterized membrane protein